MIYINKKKHSHGVFYVLLSLLLILCVVRYTLQVNIPQGILLAVAVLIAVFGDPDEIIAMCVCCIPLHTSFEHTYAILLGLVIYVVKFGRKIRLNLTVVPIFIMILWEVVHCFGESFSIVQFGGRCVPLLLLALLMCNGNTGFDYGLIVRALAVSTVAMCVSVLGKLVYVADFDLLAALSDLQRLGAESEAVKSELLVSGAEMNANSLGIICVLGLTGLLQLRNMKRGRRQDVMLMLVLLAFGILTSSRTFLVCLILMALLMLFGQNGNLGRKFKFLAGAVLGAVVVVFLLYLIAPALLEYYIGRFQVKDITTGRMDLMDVYHAFIMSNPEVLFFGIGVHDFGTKVIDVYQVAINVPHNAIQELVIAWGIPGIMLFCALGFSMVQRSRELCKKQGLVNYVPLIVILVKSQAGQLLNSEYTMLALAYAYLSMCENLTPEAIESKDQISDAARQTWQTIEIELARALQFLLRKAVPIAAVSVISAVTAFGVTKYAVTPMYESTAMFYVNNDSISLSDISESIAYSDVYASRILTETYSVILESRTVLNQVAELAGVDRGYEELRSMIRAMSVDETEIVKVVVESPDPVEARKIADAITVLLPDQIAGIIQGTSTKIVDYAVLATRPSSPSKVTNAMLGFIFGFVLSVMVVLLQAMKDTTIRTEDDVASLYPYPVLAVIPDLFKR